MGFLKKVFKGINKALGRVVGEVTGARRRLNKKQDHFYRQKMTEFGIIDRQYKLNISDSDYSSIAQEWAVHKAASEQKWYDKVALKPLTAVVLVTSIATSVATFGTSLFATAAAIAALTASALNIYSFSIANKTQRQSVKTAELLSKVSALKAKNETRSGDQLTEFIIKNPYAILANGSIYKANLAGDLDTYSPSLYNDVNKGICEEVGFSEIDEMIMGRYNDKAGNKDYYNALFADTNNYMSLPLLNYKQRATNHFKSFINHSRRINEGFIKLQEAGLNINNTAKSIYDKVKDNQLKPFKPRIVSNVFLDTMQSYQNGLHNKFSFLFHTKIKL